MERVAMTEDKFEGCILGGAIGDAWGSSYENEVKTDDSKTFYFGGRQAKVSRYWRITDDTQLTMATCEALCTENYSPQILADTFVQYYRSHKLTGIGSSTLKSILELEAGQHWSQAGRKGDYAAGNGAAMRIAPFAFFPYITKEDIFNACKITHHNDEAYSAALAVYLAVKRILVTGQLETKDMLAFLIEHLPDTNVRDRIIDISNAPIDAGIADIAAPGNNGYAAHSIPFAIFAATKAPGLGLTEMYRQIIDTGGDTDTNASIAGQIAGTWLGKQNIPVQLLDKLTMLPDYDWISNVIAQTEEHLRERE